MFLGECIGLPISVGISTFSYGKMGSFCIVDGSFATSATFSASFGFSEFGDRFKEPEVIL